jgi:hypothetical protein
MTEAATKKDEKTSAQKYAAMEIRLSELAKRLIMLEELEIDKRLDDLEKGEDDILKYIGKLNTTICAPDEELSSDEPEIIARTLQQFLSVPTRSKNTAKRTVARSLKDTPNKKKRKVQ